MTKGWLGKLIAYYDELFAGKLRFLVVGSGSYYETPFGNFMFLEELCL